MLYKLSKNTFVRQYGPFTYVLDRIKLSDQIFLNAEVFFRWITREPMEKEVIINNICSVYTGVTRYEIEHDFDEFFRTIDCQQNSLIW